MDFIPTETLKPGHQIRLGESTGFANRGQFRSDLIEPITT